MSAAPDVVDPEGWRDRIVDHGTADPRTLTENPQNWRTHPPGQRRALASVLDDVGWVQGVIVNRTTGHLVDGHLRVALSVERGLSTIPVSYVELTPEEEALILASLDPLAAMADANGDKLRALMESVAVTSTDLAAHLTTIASPRAAAAGRTDPDAQVAARETTIQVGDLFALGAHRLLCGDSRKAADVERVLDGETPCLMVTDPPYGVDYDPTWRDNIAGAQWGAPRLRGTVTNDDSTDWTAAWRLAPADVAYVWQASLAVPVTAGHFDALGFDLRVVVVWRKPHFTVSRGHYHWQHELCLYLVRHGRTARWIGDRSQSTVWDIEGMNPMGGGGEHKLGHSTQKPVECMRRPIANHEGDVYDPFCGSGTTLIAAQQLDRRCFAMEVDPPYCQMAIDRWEAFTGETAVTL